MISKISCSALATLKTLKFCFIIYLQNGNSQSMNINNNFVDRNFGMGFPEFENVSWSFCLYHFHWICQFFEDFLDNLLKLASFVDTLRLPLDNFGQLRNRNIVLRCRFSSVGTNLEIENSFCRFVKNLLD